MVSQEVRREILRLGGVARSADVPFSSYQLRAAVKSGEISRVRRDCYAIPEALDEARVVALKVGGTVSHVSAALAHGWPVKHVPRRPWVTVPRGRPRVLAAATIRVADLPEYELGLTGPARTVLDCARVLPLDEALCVADSALRMGDVTETEMLRMAASARGPGARAVRRVLTAADGRAANPFESVLRAVTLEFPEFRFEPQAEVPLVGFVVRPDLVDFRRRVVLEADSHTFHTGRQAHDRDCSRYNELVLQGWLVLRFTWEKVMHQPDYVRGVLARTLATTSPLRALKRAQTPD